MPAKPDTPDVLIHQTKLTYHPLLYTLISNEIDKKKTYLRNKRVSKNPPSLNQKPEEIQEDPVSNSLQRQKNSRNEAQFHQEGAKLR